MQTTPTLDGICRRSVYSRDGGQGITHMGYMGITLPGYRLPVAGLRLMAHSGRLGGVRSACYDAGESGESPEKRRYKVQGR